LFILYLNIKILKIGAEIKIPPRKYKVPYPVNPMKDEKKNQNNHIEYFKIIQKNINLFLYIDYFTIKKISKKYARNNHK